MGSIFQSYLSVCLLLYPCLTRGEIRGPSGFPKVCTVSHTRCPHKRLSKPRSFTHTGIPGGRESLVFSPPLVVRTKGTCRAQSRVRAHTMKGISKSSCPQQPCGAGAWLDQSVSVAHGTLGFGTLWIGRRSWTRPENETGDGELWEDGASCRHRNWSRCLVFNLACCHWQVSTELVGRAVP